MRASPTTRARTAGHTVRERLHAAAARTFARKGYAATSVQEIVRKADVTKPALYYHFGSKEGIYRAVLEAALRDFDERVDRVERLKGNASLRLRRLCLEVFSLMQRHLDVIRLMHAIYYGPPQGAPFFDFDRPLLRFHDMVRRIVRQGVRAGEFHGKAEPMCLGVLGALNECVDLQLVHPHLAVDAAGFGEVLDVVLRGMTRKERR